MLGLVHHPPPTQLYPPSVPATLTCPKCGNTWESYASSARTRCGACRSVVSVPAAIRRRSTDTGAQAPGRSGTLSQDVAYDVGDATTSSGARVLVVVGVVVAGILVFFWLRRRKAEKSSMHTEEPAAAGKPGTASPPYTFGTRRTATSLEPNGTAPLTVGAMTRWACGHEQTLVRPLAPGLSSRSAPCPSCGRPGVVAQLVAGRFVPVGP